MHTAGVSKVRPGGQMRPEDTFYTALCFIPKYYYKRPTSTVGWPYVRILAGQSGFLPCCPPPSSTCGRTHYCPAFVNLPLEYRSAQPVPHFWEITAQLYNLQVHKASRMQSAVVLQINAPTQLAACSMLLPPPLPSPHTDSSERTEFSLTLWRATHTHAARCQTKLLNLLETISPTGLIT